MMTAAVSINRHWVIVLNDGMVVIDWGNGTFQDILTGEFFTEIDQNASNAIHDGECAWLLNNGTIQGYDNEQVYVVNLPQRQKSAIE